jgi:hypothetical protein
MHKTRTASGCWAYARARLLREIEGKLAGNEVRKKTVA